MADSASTTPASAPKLQTVKTAPPPPQLPILGKVESRQVSFIGRTNYVAALEEKKFIFAIKRDDRRRHLYVIGKAGVGKSKLLELLIRQDVDAGEGFCLLDPNGRLIDTLLDFIPEKRVDDIALMNAGDSEHAFDFE